MAALTVGVESKEGDMSVLGSMIFLAVIFGGIGLPFVIMAINISNLVREIINTLI